MFHWIRRFVSRKADGEQTRKPTGAKPRVEQLESREVPTLAVLLAGSELSLAINTNGSILDRANSRSANYRGNDFFFPGLPVNHYVVARNGTFQTGNYIDYQESLIPPQPVTVTNISSGNTLAARVRTAVFGTASAGLQLERKIEFPKDGSHVDITIKLSNNSAQTYSKVAFLESSDPDQSIPTSSFLTNNVVSAGGKIVRASLALPAGVPGPLAVGYGSADPRAKVSIQTPILWSDPYPVLNSPQTGTVLGDNSINIAFDFGTIKPGEFRVTQFCMLFAPTPAAADAEFLVPLPYGNCGLTKLSASIARAQSPLRFVLNSVTKNIEGTFVVTNRSALAITKDITLVFRNVPAGMSIVGGSRAKSGAIYFTVPNKNLAANSSLRKLVIFRNPNRVHPGTFFYGARVDPWAGAFDPSLA